MKQKDIQNWIGYWTSANMVAFDQINAFDQVYQARKYCQCLRVGLFCPDLVSDLDIWRALENMRNGKYQESAA